MGERTAALAVLAIIWLLPAVRADAQIAIVEMQQIAQGLDLCSLDTDRYVSLETLNDTANSSAIPIYDYINDQGGTFVIRTFEGFFLPSRVNLLTAALPWNGPYMTYQPQRTQTTSTPYDIGSPLDPWGNPYYFFTPFGLVHGDSGTISLDLYADGFDRYTLVSLGPDGVKSADDITYAFGPGVTIFRVSSLRTPSGFLAAASPQVAATTGFTAGTGSTLVVRGLNFGATQSGAKVFWGATELTNVISWSAREVQFQLPPGLSGTAQLTIQRGAQTTNGLNLTIVVPAAAAEDWQLLQ